MIRVLVFFIIFLIAPTISFARTTSVSTTGDSSVTVNQTSEGESTTCINGNCTTTGGKSSSNVCVNGKCYESDGDLEVNENNAQVSIKNSSNSESKTNVEVKTDDSGDLEESISEQKKNNEKENNEESIFDKITQIIKLILPFI